jgi:hypothetical protein
MAYNFPEGGVFYFSQTFAGAKTVSAVSNANPAIATVTGHGYSDNDEVLFSSGWEDATDCVYRIEQTDANTLNVHGLNSTDTNFYAAGSGTGSMYKISSWVAIPQVLSISTSGGDPRFTTISPLAKRNSIVVPTGFNATSVVITLGHDASDANYITMLAVSRSLTKVAFKMVLSDTVAYGYGYMAVSEMPVLNSGQANTVSASFSFLGRAINYAAL